MTVVTIARMDIGGETMANLVLVFGISSLATLVIMCVALIMAYIDGRL